MMRPDHYATLGVAPDASAAEIRAVYLTLMRVHHPDRNPSPESAERAKAIIAAFKVLSDFDRRNHYDWDRRRDRERAAALAAVPDRTLARNVAAGVAGAGLVVAAMAGWSMIVPGPDRPTKVASAERTPLPAATPRPAALPPPVAAEPRETITRIRPVLPKAVAVERVASKEPSKAAPNPPVQKSAVPKPTVPKPAVAKSKVRFAAAPPVPRPMVKIAEPPPVRLAARPVAPVRVAAIPVPPVRVAARPAPVLPRPRQAAVRPVTDIASLDQFVMSFYGQSWRYGDAPKRAVLERTRANFVARRGACAGDTCRRDAYLDLMRDVSSIVETGKPVPR